MESEAIVPADEKAKELNCEFETLHRKCSEYIAIRLKYNGKYIDRDMILKNSNNAKIEGVKQTLLNRFRMSMI